MTLHIAIDLDDVVLGFVDLLCTAVSTEYGVDLRPEDITEWDLRKVLDPIVGENWWHWWKERDWLWAQAKAVPGAIGSIRTLRRAGHYTEIVTSKPEWAEAQTWRWLGKWRPPVNQVTIVGMDERKLDRTDAALIIDDKPETCIEWAEAGRTALLFSRPHNHMSRVHTAHTGQRAVRVSGWNGAMLYIKTLEEERT